MSRKGRKRQKPVEPGGKYSVTLPEKFSSKYIQAIEGKANQESSLNAALLYFLELGIIEHFNFNSQKNCHQDTLKVNYSLLEPMEQEIMKRLFAWLENPNSLKAVIKLVSAMNSATINNNQLISENISEITPVKPAQKLNRTAKTLINTGFD